MTRDIRLCLFYHENVAHFVLDCPLYNSIKDIRFPSLFPSVELGSLKSFFQLSN